MPQTATAARNSIAILGHMVTATDCSVDRSASADRSVGRRLGRLGPNCASLDWMIEQDDEAGALDDPANNGADVDGFIIGAGFALLLITGHIDTEGKELVLDALHRRYSFYADMEPREPAVMLRDLQGFRQLPAPSHESTWTGQRQRPDYAHFDARALPTSIIERPSGARQQFSVEGPLAATALLARPTATGPRTPSSVRVGVQV
jgi:hypothetical protein